MVAAIFLSNSSKQAQYDMFGFVHSVAALGSTDTALMHEPG